ncbi:hypothetical protein ACFWJ4_11225 [Kitasatospora sp. NPDC127067]|uniref:KUP/HAK/KT family potassium transporter n=1 Tax=Kitasatospora sp. NPDC127067 TaxID=3347126 RepID=UPI003662A2FF
MLQVPGTAVFLNRGKQTAPLALRANVEHNHVRHDQVVILSMETETVPRVPTDQRIAVDDLGYADDRIIHVTARFGYMETPDVPTTLAMLDPAEAEGRLRLDQASYFLSKIELRRGKQPTMAPWRKRLFIATSYITADAAEYVGLPRDRTVIMGSHIEVWTCPTAHGHGSDPQRTPPVPAPRVRRRLTASRCGGTPGGRTRGRWR